MSENILDIVYEHIVDSVINDEELVRLVKARNVVEYSQKDNTKWLSTTSDYPQVEVIWESFEPVGSHSNSERYNANFRVTVAVGVLTYRKMTELMLAAARIANEFKLYRPSNETGMVYGSTHSSITVGPYQPENGKGTIHGWAFQFSITFGVCLYKEN